jgi:hypothetical protein
LETPNVKDSYVFSIYFQDEEKGKLVHSIVFSK